MSEHQTTLWQVHAPSTEDCRRLARQLNLSPFLAKLLCAKGITQAKQAEGFLSCSADDLLSPFLLADARKGAEALWKAVREKKRITVFGDYDVDGISATAITVSYLRSIGAQADYFIPDRFTHGYGLKNDLIASLAQGGTQVIVSVDCGISSREEALYAKQLGLDLIVTDHHACLGDLPQASAVINPNRADCTYPFRALAGCAVAFKLICAVDHLAKGTDTQKELLERYADLLALGTVADVMPLRGENRVIVKKGLEKLRHSPHPGLQALFCAADQRSEKGLEETDSSTLGFLLAPRLNAAGRMKDAALGVELFLTQDKTRRDEIADQLCALNQQRKDQEEQIYREAVAQLEVQSREGPLGVAVASADHWHPGIIGIVASRISEKSRLPCILVSFCQQENGIVGKGSGRSIKGFHIAKALSECSDLLLTYGGHELAAGISLEPQNLPLLQQRLRRIAQRDITPDMRKKQVICDCSLSGEEITVDNALAIRRLEPFGAEFSHPLFFVGGAQIKAVYPLSEGKHVKLTVEKDGTLATALCFRMPADRFLFQAGHRVDLACTLDVNEYQGRTRVQLIVKYIKTAQAGKE